MEKNCIENNKKRVSIKTLKMTDTAVFILGGISKKYARDFLTKIGFTDRELKRIEG